MKRRRLGAEGLESLSMRAKKRRDGRRYLISGRRQDRGRFGRRRRVALRSAEPRSAKFSLAPATMSGAMLKNDMFTPPVSETSRNAEIFRRRKNRKLTIEFARAFGRIRAPRHWRTRLGRGRTQARNQLKRYRPKAKPRVCVGLLLRVAELFYLRIGKSR